MVRSGLEIMLGAMGERYIQMKEFMIIFKEGQEYLISEKKLRWVYEHGLSNIKYYKKVDAVLSVAQWEGRHNNPDNGYYSFYYNGKLIKDFTIDRYSDKNLVIIRVKDEFPGYEPGHTAYVRTPYSAKAGFEERLLTDGLLRKAEY